MEKANKRTVNLIGISIMLIIIVALLGMFSLHIGVANSFARAENTEATFVSAENSEKDLNGDETNDAYYEISNADQLYWFANFVNTEVEGEYPNQGANAVLTTNITVNENVLDENGDLNGDGSSFRKWTTIMGVSGVKYYTGMFDGQGYYVSGLYQNNNEAGFIVFNKGIVKNLGIIDSYFKGKTVGSIVASENEGTISNCYAEATLIGMDITGGLVSVNDGNGLIENSYFKGKVSTSGYYGGGIEGTAQESSVTRNSYALADVTAKSAVGGIVGGLWGIIENSYFVGTVNVTNADRYKGGLVGTMHATETVNNSYYDSTLFTGEAVGSYNSGASEITVTATSSSDFVSGRVTYLLNNNNAQNKQIYGQIIGADKYPTLTVTDDNAVYKLTCNGEERYTNIAEHAGEVHDEHNLNKGVCVYCGFVCDHTGAVNGFCDTCNYYEKPNFVKAEDSTIDFDGDGEVDAYYEISNAGQLYWFGDFVNTAVYDENLNGKYVNSKANALIIDNITVNENVLDENGDLSSDSALFKTWTPILQDDMDKYTYTYYEGTIDGQGYQISGLFIEDGTGFIGDLSGTVKNIVFKDMAVISSEANRGAGFIVGRNYGTVVGCYVENGNISGEIIGGLVGENRGLIKNSYVRGIVIDVSSNKFAGGITARNYGKGQIINVYVRETFIKVDVDSNVGGLVGENRGLIQNGYFASKIISPNKGAIVGYAYDSGEIYNVYYDLKLENAYVIGEYEKNTNNKYDISGIVTESFVDGHIAYMLNEENQSEDMVWGQNLETDVYPSFSSDTVYYYSNYGYTNHKHTVKYELVGTDTIVATCTDNNCVNSDCGTIQIVAPTETVYSGEKISANVVNELIVKTDIEIKYEVAETGVECEPISVGEYKASITLGDVTAYVIYSIDNKTFGGIQIDNLIEPVADAEIVLPTVSGEGIIDFTVDFNGKTEGKFAYYTIYTLTINVVVDIDNYNIVNMEIDGYEVSLSDDGTTLTYVKEMERTQKAKITETEQIPESIELESHLTEEEALAFLNETYSVLSVVAEDGNYELDIIWTLVDEYKITPYGKNIFAWTTDLGNLATMSGTPISGKIEFENPAPIAVNIDINNQETDYEPSYDDGYDLNQLFDIDPNAGARIFDIRLSTGAGRISGDKLYIDLYGMFIISLETASNGIYDKNYAEAVLTVNRGKVPIPVIQDKEYNGNHQIADIESCYFYEVMENAGGTEVGSYTVLLKVNDSNKYVWMADTNIGRFVELTFTISNELNVWITTPSIDGWTYGNEVNAPVFEAEFGTAVVEYRLKDGQDADYTTTVPVNAGDYLVRIKIDATDNHSGLEEVLEFTIAKREVVIMPNENQGKIYGEDDEELIYDVELVGNDVLNGVLGREDGENAGTYAFTLGTLSNDNYVLLLSDVAPVYVIEKYAVMVPEIHGKEYNGTLQKADIDSTDLYEVSVNDGGIEVGSYNVELTLRDATNYKWSGNDNVKAVVTFEISNELNFWFVEPTIIGWTYGDEANEPVYKSEFGRAVIEYRLKDATDDDYTTTVPVNVGEYYVRVKIIGTDNYTGLSKTLEFSIEKKKVTASISVNDKEYDGTTDTVIDKIVINGKVGEDNVTVANGTAVFVDKNVGVNKVVVFSGWMLSGEDSANYELISQPSNVTCEITAKSVIVTPDANQGKVYGEDNEKLTYSVELIGNDVLYGTLGRVAGETVGTYAFTLGTLANDNYVLVLDTSAPTYVITKAEVVAPEISGKEYNGTLQKADVVANDLYEIENNGGTDAGSYKVKLTLKDSTNYKWTDSDEAFIELTYSISKVANVWTTESTMNGWTYGENAVVPVYESKFGTAVVTYKQKTAEDTEYVTTVPANAGEYIVRIKVDGNNNYTELTKTIEFTISNATNVWTTEPSINGWTYGENAIVPAYASKFGTAVVTYKQKTAEDTEYTTMVPVNAGEYVVRIKVDGNDNYTELTKTFEFIIAKKAVTATITVKDKVYDGYVNAEVNTVVVNGIVGEDEVSLISGTATFTDKNVGSGKFVSFANWVLSGANASNYELTSQPMGATANITAIALTVAPNANQGKTYGEAEPTLSWSITSGTLLSGEELKGISISRSKGENAGVYEIIVTQSENLNPNYNIVFVKGEFVIAKKQITLSTENQSIHKGKNLNDDKYSVSGIIDGHEVELKVNNNEILGEIVDANGSNITANYDIVYESKGEYKEKLSQGGIAGITIGVIVAVAIAGLAVFIFVIKKKKISDFLPKKKTN